MRRRHRRAEPLMANILVVKLGALGDILLAEGALRDIRAHHPDARVSVLTRRAFVPLLARCPWVDEVLPDDNLPRWRLDAMWRLRARLRAPGYAFAYDLQNSQRSEFYLQRLLGPKVPRSLLSDIPTSDGKSLPVLQRHAAQLQAAGLTTTHTGTPGADWMCTPVETLLARAGITVPFVLLLPGSSARGRAKRWPHYAELAARLHARGWLAVTVPGPDELGEFAGFSGIELSAADGKALDLYALAGVMREAVAVVGNDSGPTHLAASLGRPGIALFGGDPRQAARTCMARGRMRVMVSPSLAALDVAKVETALFEDMREIHERM